MINITIKRSKWLRGGKNGYGEEALSTLCDINGQKCCLGFLAVQCGLKDWDDPYPPSDQYITQEAGQPSDNLDIAWPPAFLSKRNAEDSQLTSNLIDINDDKEISESAREEMIAQLMLEGGVVVTFVD